MRFPLGMTTRLMATIGLLAALPGCGGDDPAPPLPRAPSAPRAAETVSASTAALTCAQVGGTKRYPDGDLEKTERLALALAGEFADEVDLELTTMTKAFAAATLSVCHEADDPAHRPVDDLRALGETAAGSSSPLSALIPGGSDGSDEPEPEPTESSTPVADAAGQVSSACAAAPASVKDLIARAATLSADESSELSLELATVRGTIASIARTDAVVSGFERDLEAFGTTVNKLAIERDVKGSQPDKAQAALIDTTRGRALDAATDVGAESCIALLGG